MNPRAARLASWFAALQSRERVLVALSGVALGWLVFDYGLLQPQLAERARLREEAARAQQDTQALDTQLAALRARSGRDPNAALRAEVASLRARLTELQADPAHTQVGHIAPEAMTRVLREVLGEHPGVALVALKTLAAQRIDEHGAVLENSSDPSPGLRRFGVSLTLRGDYRALTSYLASLEAKPARWLWGEARLEVEDHPTLNLTLVLYTLGDEDTWLKV